VGVHVGLGDAFAADAAIALIAKAASRARPRALRLRIVSFLS
jgi:hypothetical protein